MVKVSNNEAEYEALLHGLRLAVSLGIKRLLFYGDSLLVIQQVNKEWDVNKDTMDVYVEEIRKLENKLLMRNDHTQKPESPVRQAQTAFDSNQGVPVNLSYKLIRK